MARSRSTKAVEVGDWPARAGGHSTKRAASREEEILTAAVDIFYERGYSKTSVEDVASAVGILKGSLYYYIDSKDDLLFRIVSAVHGDVQAIIDSIAPRVDEPPLERLAAYVRGQVEYNSKNIRRIAVYYHDYRRLERKRLAEIQRRRKEHEQFVVDLLAAARDNGDVPPELDVKLAAYCVFATITWMYTWYRPGGAFSGKALGEFCAQFVLNGVRGERASAR